MKKKLHQTRNWGHILSTERNYNIKEALFKSSQHLRNISFFFSFYFFLLFLKWWTITLGPTGKFPGISVGQSATGLYDLRLFHKTYLLLIYDIFWSQITDWVGAVVNCKSLKTNVECTSLQWGIMLFHHFCRLTTCKYHTQNKMYLPLWCV
jgi:hypothetical protein